eukprot:COSAG05_NODE_380_length_10564_cov_116.331676_2_plen_214_part_00
MRGSTQQQGQRPDPSALHEGVGDTAAPRLPPPRRRGDVEVMPEDEDEDRERRATGARSEGGDNRGADDSGCVVARALGTAGAGTGRCMFIAGFAYYEIGRFDFSVGRDGTYLELMTAAFVLSVVSASVSGYVQYFMSGLESAAGGPQPCPGRDSAQYRFALVLDEVIKANIVFFVLATLLYSATFARIGYTYYPAAENGVYLCVVTHSPSACG